MPGKNRSIQSNSETDNKSSEDTQNTPLKFEAHASVVFQLGESLISDAVQALIELVKNSYDADAKSVKIDINTISKLGDVSETKYSNAEGYIIVEDTGTGMTLDTIEKGWLTISNSPKRKFKNDKKTTVLGRTPLGDKGLGRLGTQRLGQNLEIYTRPRKSNKDETSEIEYYIAFSWMEFETAQRLSDVNITVKEKQISAKSGTTLVISDLIDKDYWSQDSNGDNAERRLQIELSSMLSPYEKAKDFSVVAKLNNHNVELIKFNEQVRQTAQLEYELNFNGEEFTVNGQSRLSFFRPELKKEQNEFRLLVEKDNGEAFYKFLKEQKRAEEFSIQKGKETGWFLSYESKWHIDDIPNLKLISTIDNKIEIANPGPFTGKIYSFDLGSSAVQDQLPGTTELFKEISEYRKYIKDISGVRVYRDGFGIRVDEDFLRLGKDWTSARSYYGLKPGNTVGYIAITAKNNPKLEEKTDREGFKITPHYENFYNCIETFTKFTSDVQNFLRRSYIKFRAENEKKLSKIGKTQTPESVAAQVSTTLSKASSYYEVIEKAQQTVEEVETAIGNTKLFQQEFQSTANELSNNLKTVHSEIIKVQKYVEKVGEAEHAVKYLQSQIEILRQQVESFYDTISLGITAEALSHEINNITDQLATRTQQISNYIKEKKDLRLSTYIEYANSSVEGLRKQIRHLAPSLRYLREKREPININVLFDEVLDFYSSRLEANKISVEINKISREDFVVEMNKGKFFQIIDNIFLNSEYWLREDIRLGKIKQGVISVDISKPFLRISDNGRGIAPKVESSLFEPFVSTKGKYKGRGLGLFIVQQLLDAEGCTIVLLPDRNKNNHLYIFEINLTGVVDGDTSAT